MSKLLEDFETIAGYKPYGCNDIEQLWNIRVIELLPEVDWEALKKALTELERLQKRDEDVRVKLIKRIELNKRLIKENYDIDTEVVSHLNVENTALEMVMMLMDWSDEE